MGQPGRPRKYNTDQERAAAAARRQAKHRAKERETRVNVPAGGVVLDAAQVALAYRELMTVQRYSPPMFDRAAFDELLVTLGGTCDPSL